MSGYKKQHFLPRFYLENFAFNLKFNGEKSRNVHYCSSDNFSVRYKGIDNICTESYYYSVRNPDGKYDHALETFLGRLETQAAPVIEKIDALAAKNRTRAKVLLAEADKINLTAFVAWLHLRSPFILENLKNSLLYDFMEIRKTHNHPYKNETEKQEELKQYALDIIGMVTEDNQFNQILLKKRWYIIVAPQSTEFVTSDNPVLFLYKGKGLDDPQTEIFVPLSPRTLLVLMGTDTKSEGNLVTNPPKQLISQTNQWFAKNAHSLLISHNKYLLEHLLRKPNQEFFNPSKARFNRS